MTVVGLQVDSEEEIMMKQSVGVFMRRFHSLAVFSTPEIQVLVFYLVDVNMMQKWANVVASQP